jgi:hypothetical protein
VRHPADSEESTQPVPNASQAITAGIDQLAAEPRFCNDLEDRCILRELSAVSDGPS